MKIGFDVAQTCDQKAGCGWYADALIRALVEMAPEHEFALYHQFGRWINGGTELGTHVSAANVTEPFAGATPAEAARIWQSPDELRSRAGAPEIVHANCFQAPKVPGAKLVYTVYDVSFWAVPQFTTEANRLICQRGVLEALRHADAFVFISESARTEFERMLPGWLDHSGRPHVVTPLAARNRAPAPATGEPQYWLAVGSLEPRKNYEALLDAVVLYQARSKQRKRLCIAGGSGWKSEHLRERISQLQQQGFVEYLGYVPDRELETLYAGAQALLFPSWYEGFGLPVIEAMQLGCPVICSDNTSLREVGGEAVAYIDPSAPGSIVDAMLRLEASSAIHSAARLRALERAKTFSWTATARRTIAFYQQVLESQRG